MSVTNTTCKLRTIPSKTGICFHNAAEYPPNSNGSPAASGTNVASSFHGHPLRIYPPRYCTRRCIVLAIRLAHYSVLYPTFQDVGCSSALTNGVHILQRRVAVPLSHCLCANLLAPGFVNSWRRPSHPVSQVGSSGNDMES